MTYLHFTDADVDDVSFAARVLARDNLIVDAMKMKQLADRMRDARVAELREHILTMGMEENTASSSNEWQPPVLGLIQGGAGE